MCHADVWFWMRLRSLHFHHLCSVTSDMFSYICSGTCCFLLCQCQVKWTYTPWKTKHVPCKSLVGRCISYWNSPFLGDMLVFWGVIFLQLYILPYGIFADWLGCWVAWPIVAFVDVFLGSSFGTASNMDLLYYHTHYEYTIPKWIWNMNQWYAIFNGLNVCP